VKSVSVLNASAYLSLNYSEWDDAMNIPFGVTRGIGRSLAARYMYDGERSHALLDLETGPIGISLIWVWLEKFGVSMHGGF
jgi:hypothetical protein